VSHNSKFSPATAAAIVIANMIGTGVFTSLGFQLLDIKSGFVILLLWILGGVMAISGALCYAELGARLPRSGGEYNFLSQIYHPMAGFISGCVSATVGFAAPTALAAITFGVYLSSVFPQLSPLWLATVLVVVMTLVHATSHRNSGNMQTFFTVAKIVLVIGFSIAALVAVDNYQLVRFTPESSDIELITSGSFAVALIYVGYAYSGWNAATYLTGELENPAKTLPLVLAVGTGVVMLSYVLLNTVFLLVAPMAAMEGKLEIGYVAATYAFGEVGASVMGVTLALLLVSTVSAMIIAAPRVLQVVGEDFIAFRFLGTLNKNGVPATAVYLQGGITLLFLWTASFESILIFSGATMALNTLFAVIGVFILRHREGDESVESMAVFRVPFYPLPPLLFVALTGGTLIYLTIERPVEIIFSFVVIGAGAIAYLLSKRFER
jgi:APA family basic amino acid/polyamine antiporter|tara:strand:- start:2547 stop:3857 length:1311 start_codon:yes stop_codon:yes gene_type:complete